MTEPTLAVKKELERESHAPYKKVFYTLAVFTALEYVYATFLTLPFVLLVLGLLGMAVFKAALVGIYFMHLKFEGKWVYGLLIPAGLLAIVLVLGLAPDMALRPFADENPDQKEVPAEPAPSDANAMRWVRTIAQV